MLEFVGPDQAGERLMMRCRPYCGGATDSVHRQSSGYPGCARRWWFPFYEDLHVCVLEACNVKIAGIADFEKKLALMFEIPG